MKFQLLTAATALASTALLSLASTASAAGAYMNIETWCADTSGSDDSFRCEEDGRLLGQARNLPTPIIDQNDPNNWPVDVTNYVTEQNLNQQDLERCIAIVRSTRGLPVIPDRDIYVGCGATVDWTAPLVLASGSDLTVSFGDPIERGEVTENNGDVRDGYLAKVTGISCGCLAWVEGPE